MVDSISGKNTLHDLGLLGVGQQQSVEKTNADAARNTSNLSSLKSLDEATISDAARKAYEAEKDVLRFSRLAQRIQESFDQDKVSQLKNMVDSGRINDYLRSLNTDNLADSILKSSSAAFLR